MPISDGSQSTVVRVGVRLPFASDEKFDAAAIGMYTTFNRFEAFLPDLLTISLGGGFYHMLESGINYSLNVDGVLMKPTEDDIDSELFINYNVTFWFPFEKINLGTGFAGRLIATESDLDFGERTVHQLGFAGNYDFGSLKPGIHFRIPLDDDLTDLLNYVYGFNVTYEIE